MKHLKDFLIEDCCASSSGVNSTPGNTMGMGTPSLPCNGEPGSEPLTGKVRRKQRKKCENC